MQGPTDNDGVQPTSPRLGRSDSKKKLGIFMKRTYAGVNKQTSKLASSFRKDLPGSDPEFDKQREEFEQLVGKVARLHKRVRRYNKTFSDMGSDMLDLAEVLQSFGESADDNRFGEDFMKAAVSIQQAAASFSGGVSQVDQDLKAFSIQLKQYSKQVELRDSALADLNKFTRKVQKTKKRPEAIKSQQAESRYEEVKQVFTFLNEEVKQQLHAYNSQRMLYIMPQLEKLSACHLNFLQQALAGSENLNLHRPSTSNGGSRQGSRILEERPGLPRSKTEGRLASKNSRPAYDRRQSNPELREVEPLVYREVEAEEESKELGTSPPFGSLASPATLHSPMSDSAALRARSFSQPEARKEARKTKKAKKSENKERKEQTKATQKKKTRKQRSLDSGKEKQSSAEGKVDTTAMAETPTNPTGNTTVSITASAQSQPPVFERKASFRRPSNVHPPSRPTPPTPFLASQVSDVTAPSYSSTLSSSGSSLSSSHSEPSDGQKMPVLLALPESIRPGEGNMSSASTVSSPSSSPRSSRSWGAHSAENDMVGEQ